jgi:hypothetical protein
VIPTPDLIASLAEGLQPVKRLRSPGRRAVFFIVALAFGVALVTWATGAWPLMSARLGDSRFAVEMAATALTGIAGVTAAFFLSLPDRSRWWMVLPLPPLLLWLASSGYGCYRNWLEHGPLGWQLGRSSDCFVFIVTMSIPLGAALYLALRRMAAMLDPLRVMTAGGLGVAGLAAAVLQFYHPFDVTVVDLAFHIAAVLIVVAVMTTAGTRALRRTR